MLRIKDNVDLKELEKFGFKDYGTFYRIAWFVCTFEAEDYICVDKETRKISLYRGGYIDVLFDLIQAGLVEKVGGESE